MGFRETMSGCTRAALPLISSCHLRKSFNPSDLCFLHLKMGDHIYISETCRRIKCNNVCKAHIAVLAPSGSSPNAHLLLFSHYWL